MTADRVTGISMLSELDELIAKYRERYGEGKPYQILLAIRAMYGGPQPPGRIQRGKIIRTVWRDEIKQLKPPLQDSRVRLLSNTFSAHKKILNERFREMFKTGENPKKLGLVKGEVFGVLEEEDIESYARRIKSPWLVENLQYRVELIDRKGRLAKVEKRTWLKALEPGLQTYPHEIRADGRTERIEVMSISRKVADAPLGWQPAILIRSGKTWRPL